MIRVVLEDDHPLVLHMLKDSISKHADIHLVATADHGSKLADLVREHGPDIAIVDVGLAPDDYNQVAAIRNLKRQFPNVKVLVVTNYDSPLWVRLMVMDVGVDGYMLKSDAFSLRFGQAIRDVYAGSQFLSPEISAALIAHDKDEVSLTHRDVQIIMLLDEGKSTDVIAECLGLSEKRIRNLLVILFKKLGIGRGIGVTQRVAAVNKAHELGLLPGEKSGPPSVTFFGKNPGF